MRKTANCQHRSTKKCCISMERNEHAKDEKECPKNYFLKESDVNFRKVFGIVSMIQEDMSLKNKSRKP